MGCDLCGLVPTKAALLHALAYLLAPLTGGVKILLCVSLDLRRTTAASFDFVAEIAKTVGQLGLIDGGGKLLRIEQTALLQRARLAVWPLGDVEDHGMGVKLRRRVAVD